MCRRFAPAFACGDLGLALWQLEQVGWAVQPALVVEFLDGLLAKPVDVEGRPGDQVDQPLDALRGAHQAAGAAVDCLAGWADGVAAAGGAGFGELVGLRVGWTAVENDRD